ncbi:MAG TPA: SDR family NAD(P)-dependent oxidoreductase, partial [Myxococcota bacterium]|nr:SDR family NAD(P)-dependent oxidoreductase [Myxococcota bacterium]
MSRALSRWLALSLVAAAGGSLDGLHFVAAPREAPEAGVLEVEIEAASLNFKDVMKAMGLLDADALEQSYLGSALGMEAVGRVLRGGPGTTLAAGTRVLLYSGGCIRTHALVPENFVLACPEDWTVEQAASFFVTATAWHALVDVGRVRAGETVLIHSAAGGVGLAAVGIARAFGLRVIATAGTERKRAWLREQGLEWVLDSRTLDFAEEARRITGGRGVDVVLNALAGPAIEQGLRALAPGGRFLELGKKDLADHRSLMMGAFNRRLTFSAIDLDRAATEDPGYFGPLARQVIDAFLDGRLSHLPARLFPADEVVPAFRALASGDWIGKVVIGMRQGELTVFPDRCSTFRPRPRRSWLVTGGLGGFGLALAGMLVRAGVSRVVLCGRRGVVEEEGALAALQQRAEVEVVALDVTDAEAVARLVQRLQEGDMPLGGVIHAANAYADQPLSELTPATFERALGAKAHGAWILHLATSALDLEGFVLCSSISAQVGNPGQGAYAAANCFLDGLAELRRAAGLPGTSVALGAIGDTGLVARDQGTAVHLRSLGLVPMPAERLAEAVGV